MIPQKNSLRKIVASQLKKIRQERGLSQEALADIAGLHRTYVGSVERGERNISIDNIERLVTALNCTAADLVNGDIE